MSVSVPAPSPTPSASGQTFLFPSSSSSGALPAPLAHLGYADVPRDTRLWSYKKPGWTLQPKEIFLYIDPEVLPVSGGVQHRLQTSRDLKLLCMFQLKQFTTAGYSLLPEVYKLVMGSPLKTNEIDFKKSERLRGPFVTKLKELGIDGWLMPMEARCVSNCEVCLLDGQQSLSHPVIVKDPGKEEVPRDKRVRITRLTKANIMPDPARKAAWSRIWAEWLDSGCWSPVDDWMAQNWGS